MNMQLHLPYLKKHATTPKISRFKLQDEFACRGWNTCSSPFQIKSGETKCDIISSPMKYPSSKKSCVNEDYSKKKPMLVEISNIQSVFLEKKHKSLPLKDNRNLSQAFSDFIPKLTNQEKLNVICHRKRSQNFYESSQNKKYCHGFLQNSSDINCIEEISPKKADSLNDVTVHKKVSDSFTHTQFDNVTEVKNTDFCKITEGKFFKLDTSLKAPDVLIPSLTLKNNQNELLQVEMRNSHKNLNSVLCNKNQDSFYCSKESYCKSPKYHTVTLDCNSIENSSCSDKAISVTKISDSPVLIQDESSSDSNISFIVPCSPVLFQQCDVNKNEKSTGLHRKSLCSDSLKLHDLQELFQIKKHEEYPHSPINVVFDCSPIKEKNNKHDISLNMANRFKNLSEAFANSSADVLCVNNNFVLDESIQNDCSPVNVCPVKPLITSKAVTAINDEMFSFVNEHEVSEAKRMAVNNKTFMKTIQSSLQDYSSLGDKGSNWVQTLNWDQFSQSKGSEFEHDDQIIGKKSLKNVIHGGFAEQMLKLQRRERSDRVIWNHKMNELKKKAAVNSIIFSLKSVLYGGQIIMTKSTTRDTNNEYFKDLCNKDAQDLHSNEEATVHTSRVTLPESLSFIILFKKDVFTKMRLKIGDDFSLYPPWQFLSIPSVPLPVILCTYFVEPIIKNEELIPKEQSKVQCFPVLYKSLQTKTCECDEPVLSSDYLFNSSDVYGKSVCVSVRVQRAWETAIANNRLQDILKIYDHSFSLLLQTQDNIFLELKIDFSQLSDAYQEFLSDAEGKCFRLCDVVITHRYNLKQFHQLKSVLQHIQNHSVKNEALSKQQQFCYQLIPNSIYKVPCDIPGENFPLYCDYDVKPLSLLQKYNQKDLRFSCIGKIIFQYKDDFYITDESLLCSKVKKYYLLKFENIFKELNNFLVGAIVMIKEALKDEGYLLVDKFSSCENLSNSKSSKLRLAYESRLKKIGLITYEHVLSPLNFSSKVKDLVLIKGIISQVDEGSAVSWLECSSCFGENLLEDSNSVIYCEDCACIIPKPVLKVKMEVIVQDTCLSPAKVKVQLLSSTVKRILKISEDNYQPECNISDVLKKNTGVLCCYLRNVEMTDKLKVFRLAEISSC